MSRQINQPINQVRLTNVAVVRYNRGGKRFEIACYRNKVMDFRAGLETDLSEVLQTDRIFTNVSKGQFANSKDLEKTFGTRDEEEIAKLILEKGNSLQVSDLERNQQMQNTLNQICTWVASNCVHPDTGLPYTVSQIKHLLQKNYNIQTQRAIKRQYLDAVKYLKTMIPIERAKMELSIHCPCSEESTIKAALERIQHKLVSSKIENEAVVVVVQTDPSQYRELEELAKATTGYLQILQQAVTQPGDVDLEQEIKEKSKESEVKSQSQTPEHEDTRELTNKLEKMRTENTGDSNDNSEEHDLFISMSRKEQRKAQKKSKKAQRREKEEAATRKEKLDKEKLEQEEREEKAQQNPAVTANAAAATDGGRPCNTCGGSFPNASAYRAHFRSDWHRFNQKLKLKGIPAVSEAEFLLCDAETFFGKQD